MKITFLAHTLWANADTYLGGDGSGTVVGDKIPHKSRNITGDFGRSASYLLDVADEFLTIFQYAGYLLLAWSLFQLILAFKDDATEPKVKASVMLIGSIVLINLTSIVNVVFGSAGLGGMI